MPDEKRRRDPGAAPSLQEIRQELRSLGYLRDPIAGLILPHSGAQATFARVTLLTSLRAGVLGALLIAPPLSLALGRLLRPHFQGWRDHAVLTLYLLPLLAAAIFALNLLGDLIIRALSRGRGGGAGRAERLAARVGAALAAMSSLYLAIVWGRPGAGFADESGTIALGVVLIAAAGVLVGWLIRSGALITLASLGGRLEGSARSARALAVIVGAALIGAVVLAAAIALRPARPQPRPIPSMAITPVPGRLVVIGVDGIDAAGIDAFLARADLPAIRILAERSARWTLDPYPVPIPPEVWTTIATGVGGPVHGVRSFEVYRLPGLRAPLAADGAAPAARATIGAALRLLAFVDPAATGSAPISSVLRRSRAVWEIMAAGGYPPAVVNWWGTWPAQAEGVMTVSDRALGVLLERADRREEFQEGIDASLIFPEPLLREVATDFPSDLSAIRNDWAAAWRGEADGWSRVVESAFLIDRYHLQLADRILSGRPVKAVLCYLPGLDIVLGSLLREGNAGARGEGAALSLSSAMSALAAQEILMKEIDEGLSVLLSRLRKGDLLVVVMDPGRFFRIDKRGSVRGGLWIFGDRVTVPGPRGGGSEFDVTPTLLALAGLPTSSEQPGRPLAGLTEAVLGPLGSGTVSTFGDRPEAVEPGSEGEADVLERLRSLGYIR